MESTEILEDCLQILKGKSTSITTLKDCYASIVPVSIPEDMAENLVHCFRGCISHAEAYHQRLDTSVMEMGASILILVAGSKFLALPFYVQRAAVQALFTQIINKILVLNLRRQTERENIPCTTDEEALKYVAGSVICTLKIRLEANEKAFNMLDDLIESDPAKKNKQSWTAILDRGGLLTLSEGAALLFNCIENYIVNNQETVYGSNHKLTEKVDLILIDVDIQQKCNMLWPSADCNVKEKILRSIIQSYLNIRGIGLARAVREKRKINSTKALRQTLKTLNN